MVQGKRLGHEPSPRGLELPVIWRAMLSQLLVESEELACLQGSLGSARFVAGGGLRNILYTVV